MPSLTVPPEQEGFLFNNAAATLIFLRASGYSIANRILGQQYRSMETTPLPNELQIEFFYLKKAALTFRAVNNKIRLQILHLLHENRKLTVTSIYEKLRLDQSAASQHLAILRKSGFVDTERDGKCIYYSINYKRLEELHSCAQQLLRTE